MSKHPKEKLTPRDLACIEYGKALRHLRDEYVARHYTYEYEYVEELIAKARAARERIFRECDNCIHEDAFDCTIRKERLIDCYGYNELAPTCEHYEERRVK